MTNAGPRRSWLTLLGPARPSLIRGPLLSFQSRAALRRDSRGELVPKIRPMLALLLRSFGRARPGLARPHGKGQADSIRFQWLSFHYSETGGASWRGLPRLEAETVAAVRKPGAAGCCRGSSGNVPAVGRPSSRTGGHCAWARARSRRGSVLAGIPLQFVVTFDGRFLHCGLAPRGAPPHEARKKRKSLIAPYRPARSLA